VVTGTDIVPLEHSIFCRVSGHNPSYSSSASSNSFGPFQAVAPSVVDMPYITGLPQEGGALLVEVGSWDGYVSSFAFQWNIADSEGFILGPISGQTGSELPLDASLVGQFVSCTVFANGYGASADVNTAVVGPISPS
jgi:hypothetical protein